jgi:hypothetical protein
MDHKEIHTITRVEIKISMRCVVPLPWLNFKIMDCFLECPIIVHFNKWEGI